MPCDHLKILHTFGGVGGEVAPLGYILPPPPNPSTIQAHLTSIGVISHAVGRKIIQPLRHFPIESYGLKKCNIGCCGNEKH